MAASGRLAVLIAARAAHVRGATGCGRCTGGAAADEGGGRLEDGTEKSAVTPGPLAPARELLGEMLLQMNEPVQALEQFEATLSHEPGRFRSLYGAAHAAELSGRLDTSEKYFRELLQVCARADQAARPELQEAQRAILRD